MGTAVLTSDPARGRGPPASTGAKFAWVTLRLPSVLRIGWRLPATGPSFLDVPLSIISFGPFPTAHSAGAEAPLVLWQGRTYSGNSVLPTSPMAGANAPLVVRQGRTLSAYPGREGSAPLWAEGPPGSTAPLWAEGSPCQDASGCGRQLWPAAPASPTFCAT